MAPEFSPAYVEQAISNGTNWLVFAACRTADVDLFSPPDGERREAERYRKQRVAEAVAYCAVCPVMAICRADAIATGEVNTVRGGLSEKQLTELHEKKIRNENMQIARRRAS